MAGPAKVGTISTVTQYALAEGQGSKVGSIAVQFEYSAGCDASISIVGRTQRGGDDINRSLLAVAYKNYQTGVSDTDPVTTNKSMLIDASGLEVFADCTTITTGSVAFTAIPLMG